MRNPTRALAVCWFLTQVTGSICWGASTCGATTDRAITAYGVDYNHILVSPGDLPSGYLDELSSAEAAWNSSACNTGSHSEPGHAFPLFTGSGSFRTKIFTIDYNTGFNPANNQSCGRTLKGNTNTIFLYEKAKRPDGTTFLCTFGPMLTDTITHELGHTLGLLDNYDQNCANRIMNQVGFNATNQYIDRTLQANDCEVAAVVNETPAESKTKLCETNPEALICSQSQPAPSTCEPCSCH